jgi:hypothetical protein
VSPRGFGISRWCAIYIDQIGLPVALPLVVYLVCAKNKECPGGFILLSLIPIAIIRAAAGSSAPQDPLYNIVTPILWTASASSIAFVEGLAKGHGTSFYTTVVFAAMLAFTALATSAYWALFSQMPLYALAFSAVLLVATSVGVARNTKKEAA